MSEITDNKGNIIQVYDVEGSQAKESGELQNVKIQRADKKGYIGRISGTWLKGAASPKEPTLFNDLPEEEKKYWLPIKGKDEEGKPIYEKREKPILLTNKQAKTIYALLYYLTRPSEFEYLKDYQEIIEKRDKNGRSKAESLRFARPIDLRVMALILKKSDREEDVLEANEMLEELTELRQVQYLYFKGRNGEDESIKIEQPLLTLGGKIWKEGSVEEKGNGDETQKIKKEETRGRKRKNEKELKGVLLGRFGIFSPTLIQNITSNFFYIKPKLFDLWGKRIGDGRYGKKGNGTETELFPILLSELGSKFRMHYLKARKVSAEVWKDNSILKKDKEKVIAQRQKKELTYTIFTETIKSKVTTNYNGSRKMKIQFFNHLEQVIDVLVEIGLITNETRVDKKHKDEKKGYKVNFVFNYNYTDFEELEEPEE